jgi:hypothetical protein
MDKRNVKDKRIEKAGLAFVASVHLYDGRILNAGRHATLKAAQKALERFPPDVFEGYDDPTSDRAILMFKRERATVKPRPRRKKSSDYERLYDRRIV